jgi:SAM-dependent methyltransferase
MDPIAQFKENQKAVWAGFAQLESITGSVSPKLVSYAGIRPGQMVLDVACGTGVAGLTAARRGAKVTGIDLTPELVARAKENAALMGLEASFQQGDAEALPFGDASFDVVISQFGHMFAPRPEFSGKELLRVLKPGGTVAFTSWPPDLYVGRMFMLLGKYAPPPPPGAVPPVKWGDPTIVRERLGAAVKDLTFSTDTMWLQTLSVPHFRAFTESTLGPLSKLVAKLGAEDPPKLAALRGELEALISGYFQDNHLKQDFLLTRAVKA